MHRILVALAVTCLLVGCGRQTDVEDITAAPGEAGTSPGEAGEVVVYTALDRIFSEPILQDFEKETGIKVRAKYDTESTKTVGLVNTLVAEQERPRCDVFWNNEIVNTIRLKEQGLLAEYRPQAAAAFPEAFRDPDGTWTGFAARARILLVNTDLVQPFQYPDSILDLSEPQWQGRTGIAKPLFGTTASHAACLYGEWGEERAAEYFASLKANDVRVLAGNKQVAVAVGAGNLAFGMTDTDDAMGEIEAGNPVAIVYPDGRQDQHGTLFIPNTLSLIEGAPNADNGRKLIEYLLRPEVEVRLAKGPSAQIPVNPAVTAETRVKTPKDVKPMRVDFDRAAKLFAEVSKHLEANFLQ